LNIMMQNKILSCDWGTTSFRMRLINLPDQKVLAEIKTAEGISSVYNQWLKSGMTENEREVFYKAFLLTQIDKFSAASIQHIPLIISGMATSSIGIKELPYASLPFSITGDDLQVAIIFADIEFSHDILLVAGIATGNDVMRGEETMLLGCNFDTPGERMFIFPGTHSKHVLVKDKMIVDFKTYMTGEMFDLLANKSILSNSVEKNTSDKYISVFKSAVKQSAEINLLNVAFHVRTNQLFKKFTPEENYFYLSGLVIGAELKEAAIYDAPIELVCSEELVQPYLAALKVLCVTKQVQYTNADNALINAHCKLAEKLLTGAAK
jgi:2-dehydro-3-deoxygalactonokinase